MTNVPDAPTARIEIAREDDTVGEIIFREFGRVDSHLLEEVQRLNPEIEDMNQIFVGQEIKLPEDPGEAYRNPGVKSYFSIHIASFPQFDGANELFRKLIELGDKSTIIPAKIGRKAWYSVTFGEYENLTDAFFNAKRLRQSGRFTYAKPIKVPELKQAAKEE